jgi:hypothetical protein
MKEQSAVNYRPGTEVESCGKCAFFSPPEKCAQVKGEISSGALCDLYTPAGAQTDVPPAGPSLEDMLLGGGLPNV